MSTRGESTEKLKTLVEDIDFSMLTTIQGGLLRSRPMSTQQFEFDGGMHGIAWNKSWILS